MCDRARYTPYRALSEASGAPQGGQAAARTGPRRGRSPSSLPHTLYRPTRTENTTRPVNGHRFSGNNAPAHPHSDASNLPLRDNNIDIGVKKTGIFPFLRHEQASVEKLDA